MRRLELSPILFVVVTMAGTTPRAARAGHYNLTTNGTLGHQCLPQHLQRQQYVHLWFGHGHLGLGAGTSRRIRQRERPARGGDVGGRLPVSVTATYAGGANGAASGSATLYSGEESTACRPQSHLHQRDSFRLRR